MASKGGVRKYLRPIGHGPWLTDPTAVRVCGRLSLAGFGVFLSLIVLLPHPRITPRPVWVGVVFWTMPLLFVAACGLLAVTVSSWVHERAVQYCPDCLRSMSRGAYVCPWCGFRETP